MNWINYHHLYYFWTTARLGSIVKASKELSLSRPTISSQIKQLEDVLGQKLFQKSGRNIELTRFGRDVMSYSNDIFGTGEKLREFVSSGVSKKKTELTIGVSDVLPKLIAYKLISPIMQENKQVKISIREGAAPDLLAQLATGKLDSVFCDEPVNSRMDIRVFHHKLGDSGLSFFCSKQLLDSQESLVFPECLNHLPILLPSRRSNIRRSINVWFEQNKISPEIVAEFDDSALMKVFGQNHMGVFVSPTIVKEAILERKDIVCIGSTKEIRDTFYMISTQKKIMNPLLMKLTKKAKSILIKI